jgi:hypothetical protein
VFWGKTLQFVGFDAPLRKQPDALPVWAKGYILPEVIFDGEKVKVETLKLAVSSRLQNGRYRPPFTDMVINGIIYIGIDSSGALNYATDGTHENQGHTLEGLDDMLLAAHESARYSNPQQTIPEIERYLHDTANNPPAEKPDNE